MCRWMMDVFSEVGRLVDAIVGMGRGYGEVQRASEYVECCTSSGSRPPVQTILRMIGRESERGREEIHCMNHNEKSWT